MLTPPNLRRSPVSGPREPLRWNSCCIWPCQPHMMRSHQKEGKTYKRRPPTTSRSKNSHSQRRRVFILFEANQEADRTSAPSQKRERTERRAPAGGDVYDQQRQHFLHHAGWGWELTDASSVLATLSYLGQVLIRSVTDSPDLLAHELLNALTHDAADSPLGSSPVDLYALSGSGTTPVPLRECARDVVWMRALTVMEHCQRYVHKYVHLYSHQQEAVGV